MLTPEEAKEIKQTLSAIQDAFPRDDLGKPDFHGHRKEHMDTREDEEWKADIKDEAAKHVMYGVIGLFFVFLAAWLGFK